MLDKRRNRRMNNVLAGLGDLTDFVGDLPVDAAAQDTTYVGDLPVDSGITPPGDSTARATLPDFPTVFDETGAPPVTSANLDMLNKVISYGGKLYQYTQGRDSSGKTVAVPKPYTAAQAAQAKAASNTKLLFAAGIAALLFFS